MFSRQLSFAGHTRRFTVAAMPSDGWEMLVEEDEHLLRRTHYSDWHRVERALGLVEREIRQLQETGWTLAPGALAPIQSTKR